MPLYLYKAADSSGKIIKGTLEGAKESDVAGQLQDMGCIPIHIRPVKKGWISLYLPMLKRWAPSIIPSLDRISRKEVILFTQDMATLLGAGLPVDRALTVLMNAAETQGLKDMIGNILKDVQGGSDLSDALTKHPGTFSRFYINMVRAGEMGGVLEAVLKRMGDFMEASQDMREYIISAMIYPLFLVSVGGASIIIMLTFVIPRFSIIFSDMGQTMPLSTRIILDLSQIMRTYWWIMLLLFGTAWFFAKRYIDTPSGRLKTDRYLIDAPLIGRLIRMLEVARFTRALGTLMNSGVPILKSLGLIKEIAGNKVVANSLETTYDRVKEGERLSKPLAESGIFPSLAIQMVVIGEETGKLTEMLIKVAETYEKTLKNLIKRLINLLEPAMILFMGLVVGFIVISMLMAVFSMNDLPF